MCDKVPLARALQRAGARFRSRARSARKARQRLALILVAPARERLSGERRSGERLRPGGPLLH